ncbi:MAG: dephospho-CoA kinase, partial [Bacillota bacterium]|nr:dephospho-CoA kinase [Bacillota bacterium]
MFKVGLTGGIGSGKSTVSEMFKNKGISIIDADIVSREVFNIYPEIYDKIRKEFGESFFDEKNNLKRREFGSYIFKNKDERKKYEAIIMPFIKKEINDRIDALSLENKKICILDAPTLIENGVHKEMDLNILVSVDLETQIERVKKRDNLSFSEVMHRINSQMTIEEKKQYVDFIIDNS